jgi:hypothetical protein
LILIPTVAKKKKDLKRQFCRHDDIGNFAKGQAAGGWWATDAGLTVLEQNPTVWRECLGLRCAIELSVQPMAFGLKTRNQL